MIGAGPGDPELLTIKALKAMRAADVVLYDHLVSHAVLDELPKTTELICVGKRSSNHTLPQAEIGLLLIELARQGKNVVRLKGGDGYIFGRGGEEAEVVAAAGVALSVIPGLTAAQGAAAACGIPLTHRDHAQALVLVTGHLRENKSVDLDWDLLARPNQTVVIYMGMGTLETICRELQAHGLDGHTSAALVENATLDSQRCITGTVDTLPALAQCHGVRPPALIMIGGVVSVRDVLFPEPLEV